MNAFAWPLAFLLLAIVFMLIFRGPIAKLIGRIRRIERLGVAIADNEPLETSQSTEASTADELLNALNSVTLQDQEQSIVGELNRRAINAPAERERVLVRYLAGAQIAYQFELINSAIWASQIALLQSVNRQTQGVLLDDLRQFHEVPLSKVPAWRGSFPIEEYLAILIQHHLLIEEGGRFIITHRGRDFLVYLVHRPHTGSQLL